MCFWIISLLIAGVNVSNFPVSVTGLGFHLGLGAIFALYYFFWLNMSMFTTLKYLIMIGVVTFLCGNSMLSKIAEKRKSQWQPWKEESSLSKNKICDIVLWTVHRSLDFSLALTCDQCKTVGPSWLQIPNIDHQLITYFWKSLLHRVLCTKRPAVYNAILALFAYKV